MDYLYYKRGDEWVRVNADRFTQLSTPSESAVVDPTSGNCETVYFLTIYFEGLKNGVWSETTRPFQGRVGGPVTGIITIDFVPYPQARLAVNDDRVSILVANEGTFGSENYRNFRIYASRDDGLPDNCSPTGGGACETKFYQGASLVLTLSDCPEVTNNKGCSDCCQDLLAIARSIGV